jgi:hypothetical protein
MGSFAPLTRRPLSVTASKPAAVAKPTRRATASGSSRSTPTGDALLGLRTAPRLSAGHSKRGASSSSSSSHAPAADAGASLTPAKAPTDMLEREAHRFAEHATRTPAVFDGQSQSSLAESRDVGSSRAGELLPDRLRRSMERGLGEPLDDVRIHRDSEANRLAKNVHARAFTVGDDLFFRRGQFEPQTDAGRRLIAHELAHVVQQRRGSPADGASAGPLVQREPTPGEPDPPRSLMTELNPSELTDQQLREELTKIGRWLRMHPEESPERTALEAATKELAEERDRRERDRGAASEVPATPAPAGVSLAASDLDLSPATSLFGRAYPFARTPTGAEAESIRAGQVFHYTPTTNAPSIAQPGGNVLVTPSRGLYRNLSVPGAQESAYFFPNRPTAAQQGLNLFGSGPTNQQGEVIVNGASLPKGILLRPLDQTVVVPGGYKGPGAVVAPGEQLPLPLPEIAGTTAEAVPLARPPGMGGAAAAGVGLGIAAGIAQQHRIEEEVKATGYAPAGPSAYHGVLDVLAHFFVDPSMRSMIPGESRFNLSTWRENVRQHAAAVPVGGTLSVSWQVHKPSLMGGSQYTGHDVLVVYERVSAGEWRARVPPGGQMVDGVAYFGKDDGGQAVPNLATILSGSDGAAACELSGTCT